MHQLQLTIADLVLEIHDTHHPLGPSLYYEDQRAPAKRRTEDFWKARVPKYLGYFEELVRHSETSTVIREIMAETEAVAAKLGIELPISIDQRMAGAEKVGAHKTSMLQDLEAGRPLELEPIVGATVELGERLGVPMPATRAVYACAKMLDEKRRGTRGAS